MRVLAVLLGITIVTGVQTLGQKTPAIAIREFTEAIPLDETADPTANVAVGDLDSDGDLDIVLAKGRHDGVLDRFFLNDGKGRFSPRDLSKIQDPSYSATPIDMDGDKDLDIVVSNDSQAGRVYLNDGRANFSVGSEWGGPKWPSRNAIVADLNGDRFPDVVVANRALGQGRRSAACFNDGKGSLKNCVELEVGPATSVVPADFDRDGDLDLAVPYRDGGQSLLLYNDGKGGFATTSPFGPATVAARAAAAADLNGDKWPDLILGDERVSTFVYFNDGRGKLGPGQRLTFDSLPAPYSFAVGDLNRDGHTDIVIGHANDRGSVLFNEGNGRSYRHVRFGERRPVYGVALGDLDGDGFLDIAAARDGAPSIVYLNRPGPGLDRVVATERMESPLISSFNPNRSGYGLWKGQVVTPSGYRTDVQVSFEELRSEKIGNGAGAFVHRLSAGVPFCLSRMTLRERTADGTYVFAERGLAGCAGLEGTAEARWTDDNRVLLVWPAQKTQATLERVDSPIPLLTPRATNQREPWIGVWRGMQADATTKWGMELEIERVTLGEKSGRLVYYSPSPIGTSDFVTCLGDVSLREKRADGMFIFALKAVRGGCNDDTVYARLADDRLVIEWYWSGRPKPDGGGTLERKR